MVSLLYLKHAYNECDEGLVERWSETPTWQYFSGMAYFEHRAPCDPSLIGKFRKLIGEEGVDAWHANQDGHTSSEHQRHAAGESHQSTTTGESNQAA
jgi:hypothetical protein